MIMQMEAEGRERGRTKEVDEKELVAGGRRVCQGNALVACTNKHYLAPID